MDPSVFRASPLFGRLPAEALALLGNLATERTLPAGGVLWREGEPSEELALVVSGGLSAQRGAQEVGTVAAGELLGEAGVFFAEPRMAGVTATAPTRLAVLSRAALLGLRGARVDAYDLVLDRALEAMARRVQAAGRRVAQLGNGGVDPPQRKAPSALSRLFRLGASAPTGDAPSPSPVLEVLPILRRAGAATLGQLAASFVPRRLQVDDVPILEGEPGDSAFLLGEGEMEVVRAVRGGRARRLAAVRSGAVLGTGSLLLGERRNASVRVSRAGWAWEISRSAHGALGGTEAGRAWRESLLVSLREQLVQVGQTLADLKGGTTPSDRARLREATEHLAAIRTESIEADDPWSFRGRARD